MDPATISMIMGMMGNQGGGQGGHSLGGATSGGLGGGQGGGGFGGGGGGGGLLNGGGASAIGQILHGLFTDSGKPYKDAQKQYDKYGKMGADTQNPFLNYGKNAMPKMNEWLEGQKDPSGFINKLMGQYSESPWAKYQQDQSARRFGNEGSATGMTGSTPLTQFEQQSMQDISSQDQQKWLSNVLGINTQYGQGLQNQVGVGQGAANSLTNLYSHMGDQMGEAAYGKSAGRQANRDEVWGGIFG